MDKTKYITKKLKEQPEKFEMVNEPMGPNICFWYIPPVFREDRVKYTDDYKASVHKLIFDKMI